MNEPLNTPAAEVGMPERSTGQLRFAPLFTVRGFVVSCLVLYLLLGPVSNDRDVIATVLALSFAALLLSAALVTTLFGLRARHECQVTLRPLTATYTGQDEPMIVSGVPIPILIELTPFYLPPFFPLSIKMIFEKPGVAPIVHRFYGSGVTPSQAVFQLIFPHRGNWRLSEVKATVGDQFGFTALSWEIDFESSVHRIATISVDTPLAEPSTLPILCSAERSGDTSISTRERDGDHYDLKPYHPSDGMRRIVWKIYARTGALRSRAPEPSFVPEGKTALFVAAGRFDDLVAASAVSYAEKLLESELDIVAGVTGGATLEKPFANSPDELRTHFREAVWYTPDDDEIPDHEAHLQHYVEAVRKTFPHETLERVVILFEGRTLTRAAMRAQLSRMMNVLSSDGIEPTLICCIDRSAPRVSSLPRSTRQTGWARWFVFDEPRVETGVPVHELNALQTVCAQAGWQFIVEEQAFRLPASMRV